ncbi:hypothetical protein HJC22_02000 [Corallococcus exiguus]|uniref:hypothetical protein n=1 Tax=Corallococcus TaxID=83461 RepID=UPI000EE4B079|nr:MULTISPECIES: hypothetical protein [Corallococcus]NNC14504.1 hypothetical protein [Corallococcus exiguus]NPC68581.1 hypothetical protein [Corallococcus exiguus]NPD22407.1 hypothetical protein [Corallococcus exiguus]RKI19507.1 hypothetical protein D7Y15_04160 [Corallococcus sp. AB030]
MRKLGLAGVLTALWAVAALGCGGVAPAEEDLASTEQGLEACVPNATYCRPDGSRVCDYDGFCRLPCTPGGPSSQCGSREQCCLGYYDPSEDILVLPHCAPSCNYPQ